MSIRDFVGKPKVAAMTIVAALIAIVGVAAVADVGLKWLAAGDAVSVHEVRVDHRNRAYVEIVFTRPVAPLRLGEVVLDPPASFFPAINGIWRWTTGNVLRFEPAGGFPIASQYKLALATDRIATPAFPFRGEREFVIRTDDFVVRTVTWREVPAGNGTVILQGEIAFNYRVDPAALAPRIRLSDGGKVELITGYQTESVSWRTLPLRKEKQQREIALIIDKDLFPVEGNVTLGRDSVHTMTIGSNERLTVRGVNASAGERESTIRIELSSPVTADAIRGKLTIAPAAKYGVETEGNDVVLSGKFTPGRSYDLTIAEGLVATDAALLRDEFRQTVAIADLAPLLAFQSEGMFLSASGRRNVAVDTINVSQAKLVIDRVYRNNLFYYLQSTGRSWNDDGDVPYYRAYYESGPVQHRYGDRIVEKPLTFPATRNERATSTIPIGSLVKSASPGLYKVSIFRGDEEWNASTRWILITDLGIVAKRSAGEVVVWAASFKDLTPIANARVSLIDDQNQTLAQGRTDGSGFWTARGLKEKAHPFLVTIERGKDFSFLLLGDSRVDMSAFDVGGATLPASGYTAFLYGERTLYRPGETLHGVASVRSSELRFPPQMPLVLQHIDPTGEQRGSIRLTADATGLATYDLPLPAYSRTGRHTLNLLAGDTVIGSTTFHVEEFVPDRIKVEIEPQKSENLQFTVTSAYLFGAPASALAVETKVRLVPSVFRARGYDAFTFHAPSRKFDPRELSVESGTLDEHGRKQYTVDVPDKLAVPSSLDAVITARVQEQGGRGVAATTRVPVHPYPYYVGVRELPREGATRRFEWVTLAPDGKETSAPPMRAEFYEERWHTVLRQTSSGGYAYESTQDSEEVKTISIAGGKSSGVVTFEPADWGSYRLAIADPVSLAATEITFDSWSGTGYSPWAMKNPGRLELTLEKTVPRRSSEGLGVPRPATPRNPEEPEELATAVLTIKSPFRGKALITVERDRVLHTSVTTLTSNTARVEVPLPASARPNAYITATVVRAAEDLEPGEAGRAFGAIRVDVDRAENELRPELRVVEEMRSSRALQVSVKTAPNARVTIAAVDQGILQLVSEKRPDPFEHFYQRRALDVVTHDIFALLLPEVAAKNKAIAGGSESGEGISQFLRTDGIRRAKPVSFWSGLLTSDANGIVNTTFAIPDFQGAVRVTAVVHTEEQFGSSDALVRVHDPVVVMATVPRFVSANDTFSLPVTVRNDTRKSGTFEVTANVTGNAALTSDATQRVTIDRNREATVLFALRATKRGDVDIDFRATGNDERGTAAAIIPVFPALPDATDERSGSITAKSMTLPAPSPDRFEEGSAQREVIISPLPILQLRARLDYLVHYPYGCVEQTTSTAFPMIYISEIASELDPETFRTKPAAGYVREAIRRLGTMQTASGGFAMWPYGSDVNVWGSIYVTHFFTEAKRAGYGVDAGRYNRALEYVAQLAKARPEYDRDGLQQAVYALYVLARAQRADLGTMDYIREKHASTLTYEARALLGAAYAAVGNPSAVSAMLADIEREETVTRQTGGNYNSTLRNRALVVLALLDAKPNDARLPRLATRLARDIVAEPHYTTQDSAMALLALGQFFRTRKSNATYQGTLLHDGKVIGRFGAKTARFPKLPATGTLRVVIENGYVADAAYFTVRVRGTPAESAFRPHADGLRLTRTFMDRNHTPLAANDVKQGDLVIIRTEVESTAGAMQNVVIQVPLPAGLEVENPRLSTTENLFMPQHADIRDDRVLFFVDLHAHGKQVFDTVARAITPGQFRLPPAQAEAMYAPSFRATEGMGTFKVTR